MKKRSFIRKAAAWLGALAILTSSASVLDLSKQEITAAAADTGSRILVDLNKNDGRKASYAKNANNWIVNGETSATYTVNGVTMEISASGGSLRMENNKKLQKMSGVYSHLTMDAATVDCDNGGTLTLKISGLSDGTHSVKTYHSATGNQSVSGISVSASGGTSQSGISCPQQVTNPDDAGIGYVTFTGTSTTITIKASSGNAWLNAFEIDGGDPIKGVNHVYPADQEAHLERENGLSWKAGSGAASHNVYIGTSYDGVFSATTGSSEFKGNQTGTTYALDETYQSSITYYWRVDTVDGSGNVIKGSVNSFNVARLAFPTAEGYGRYARGGQGGVVVHVTNLKDDGSEGSLRWALCDAKWQTADWKGVPRIIVFDVGGVIPLTDTLCIPDNAGSVYVAGQTAPGDGITLINYDFGAMGTTDAIIRDIRVRVGDMNGSSHGGMGLSSCNHTIVDHCSISWATDEGFSSRQAQNITFQWNIIGESLNNSVHYNADDRTQTERHAFAASIGGYTGSYHHNLLIDCTGRNWSLAGAMEQDAVTYGGQADIRNNVVYNWRDRTTDGGVRRLNFVNNYYKAGPVSNTSLHVVSIDGNELGTNDMQKMYVSGNVMTKSDGSYILKSTDDAWAAGKAVSGGKGGATVNDVRSNTQFFEPYVNTQSAEDAYKSVIASVGAGGTSDTGWDYIDSRYIKEVSNGTYTYTGSKDGLKGIIDSQNDVGGYPSTSTFAHSNDGVCNAANDTDRDGMPDTWEEAHGLNPNDTSDGSINSLSPDGYTNIEMFLNELCGDNVVYGEAPVSGKEGAVIETAHKYTITNVNSGYQLEAADGTAENGTNVQQGNTGAAGWTMEDAGNGYYRIYSEVGDGKTYLLDLDYGKTDNGTNIGIWSDTASDAQLFKFVDNGDGTYNICTKATKDESCLGVTAGSTEAGANVVQWVCNGSDDQKWTLEIMVDPISGELVKDLVVENLTFNKSWNYKFWNISKDTTVGGLVFGDRDVTYVTLPDALLGGETILTSCDHKYATGTLATFTAGADMTVYAAFDQRVTTLPAWLSDWTKTDLTAAASNDVVFVLYAKEVSAGDTVTLGENGQSASCVNYTVFAAEAKAAETTTTETTAAATTTETTTTQTSASMTETTASTAKPAETTQTETTASSDTEAAVIGDVNCDDTIDILDVLTLNKNLLAGYPLSDQASLNADTDGDGVPTSTDALNILKFTIGLITSFQA